MADDYSITKTDEGVLYLAKNGTIQERLYRMKEALKKIGITAPTYYRWVNSGQIQDVQFRDRANWRLFTESDIQRIKAEATKVNIVTFAPPQEQPRESDNSSQG